MPLLSERPDAAAWPRLISRVAERRTQLTVNRRAGSLDVRVLTLIRMVALVLAGAAVLSIPFVFWFAPGPLRTVIFALMAIAGCGGAFWLLLEELRIIRSIGDAANAFGLDEQDPRTLSSFAGRVSREFSRYHRAGSICRAGSNIARSDVGAQLRRIAQLSYQDLNANAVELSLFDEVSGHWSQGLVIGAPRSPNSQGMLSQVVQRREREVLIDENGSTLVMPLMFAGTTFGALRVELPVGAQAGATDLALLQLLATEGAILLVDARFTDELLKMRRASEESVRAKTGFLANLSHEIRGPLGTILNWVELMQDGLCGELSEMQKETLKMMRDSGDHLLDLVNDVLDYAKVEAGKIVARPLEIPLAELLADLTTVVRSQALAKQHNLVLEPVDRSLGILCDKRHARQMLINFLTNAIKYTPDGGTITVTAQRLAGNRVKVSVADTGIGIPAAQRDKVFAAFERVDDSYALAQKGTGLGMPLTRRLAEVNGGNVDFESTEGQGSTFFLVLPAVEIAAADEGSEAGDAQNGATALGQGERILVVDNDRSTREMLDRYLTAQGFTVVDAEQGSTVIRLIRENPIDVAVVENDMPDLPGEEVVGIIRSNPQSTSVPIILLSARAFVFDIERFLKLGVDRCLSKPVALSELAHTVRRLIDETRANRH